MITILGRGAWGSALASVLENNKKDYVLWDRVSKIDPESKIIIAIPTQAIREVLSNNKEELKKCVIINTSKGIEKGTHKLPFEIAREVLGSEIKYLSLSGPSFAVEVEEKMPTLLNLSSIDKDSKLELRVKEIFENNYFKIRTAGSSEAIELSGALKNIYAILSGISEGLGFGMNTRSQLIGHALKETINGCKGFNYKVSDESIECITGDLVLTCSSLESRNFRFGKYLTKLNVDDALKQVGSTVEGRHNSQSVPFLQEKTGSDLLLANFVCKTINVDNPEGLEERFREVLTKV